MTPGSSVDGSLGSCREGSVVCGLCLRGCVMRTLTWGRVMRCAVWACEGSGQWVRVECGLSFDAAAEMAAELGEANAAYPGREFVVVPHGWHPWGCRVR